ncbi:MAG TPA: hypothetical protein VIG37_06010 [Methylomirabilota bacterium]|jgi:hypothetical protein
MRLAQRPLTPGWVAGSVRARHLLARRLGREQALALARSASLEDGLALLAGSAYGRSVRAGMDLASAQRAVGEATLWHLRVLAGWVPPRALEPVRALAAWFELANIEDRLAYLAGGEPREPFALGGLATVWPRVAGAQSSAEVRAALVGSPWGDPGADDPAAIGLGLRFAWGRRVLGAIEEADWAVGAMALLVARELFLAGRTAESVAARRPLGLGSAWPSASNVRALRDLLPPQAAWALHGVEEPADLWRGEVAWWKRVELDGERLARAPHLGRATVIGCVVLLGVDAWRTVGALEAAARGASERAMEAFGEIA